MVLGLLFSRLLSVFKKKFFDPRLLVGTKQPYHPKCCFEVSFLLTLCHARSAFDSSSFSWFVVIVCMCFVLFLFVFFVGLKVLLNRIGLMTVFFPLGAGAVALVVLVVIAVVFIHALVVVVRFMEQSCFVL